MRLVALLVAFALTLSAGVVAAQPPWPAAFTARVVIADSFWPLVESSMPFTSVDATFAYSSGGMAWTLTSPTSGAVVTEYVLPGGGGYSVDATSGVCSPLNTSASYRYNYITSEFLASFKLGSTTNYFQTTYSQAFVLTTEYSLTTLSEPFVQGYWVNEETLAPFRLSWGAINPTLVEFQQVFAGVDPSAVTPPSSCASVSADAPVAGRRRREAAAPRSLTRNHAAVEKQRAAVLSGGNGTAWPQQWHGTSAFTGNNFGLGALLGLGAESYGLIGEPTIVPMEQEGEYYYDWVNQRELNTWTNSATGALSKTLIVNGTYYDITSATGECLILPIAPVTGPLKYDWPTRIPYLEEQWLPTFGSFSRAAHYQRDVIHSGLMHSFNYWSDLFGQPMQFQGPVLDFPPYGQSMMVWRQVHIGFEDVVEQLDSLFYVPDNCTKVTPPVDQLDEISWRLAARSPLLLLSMALAQLGEQ